MDRRDAQTEPMLHSAWLEAGPLRMARQSRQVTVAGRDLALTEMEAGVLRLLLLHQGRPLDRTAILAQLYPAAQPEARVVDVFICRLRAKLARAGLPCVIGTVWRRGYLLQVARPEPPREHALGPVDRPAPRRLAASAPRSQAPRLGLLRVA